MSHLPDDDRQPVCRTTRGFPCVDGPLQGEFHDRGASFEYAGARVGQEDGTYELVGLRYVWRAG